MSCLLSVALLRDKEQPFLVAHENTSRHDVNVGVV
jgi:hypothetical protein